jgi:lysophospholipase L1-like esterase
MVMQIQKRTFIDARSNEEGTNLGLGRINVSIWWQGQGGMHSYQMLGKLKLLKRFEAPPKYLIIHCGGNDIGCRPSIELRHNLELTLRKIQYMFPATVIIWYQILPRLAWRGEQRHEALETVKRQVNSKMGTLVKSLKLNGHYINYLEISDGDKSLFLPDGVHLNKMIIVFSKLSITLLKIKGLCTHQLGNAVHGCSC